MTERNAVVTGGGKGIGQAVALRLAADGLRVTVLGRDEAALTDTAAAAPGRITAVVCDVADEASVMAVFGALGRVDVLVNNAGVASSAPTGRTSLADWEATMRVNATGVFLCTRAVIDPMRAAGWGRIVTVASVASHHGAPYISAYAASKHAALGFMRSVAAELRRSGVTANCVCPGYVRSDMTDRTIDNIVGRTGRDAGVTASGLNASLGRLIEPDEVAAAVAYLASDAAAAVNGQSLVIDGGDSV
ncbi:MAG: SDR family NAD(P)-dependent oxidoreductase [Actinobacteria bacterium]|nr:SDR family NAD(P)-dependent oxidoreductase [Actinomycetota bacterium]MSX86470.1 SDR family NAD(P)-dependent oxidoreductase [Actinomycetota bacterium]MSY72616.1 SDR family NAD(P)-dependent oxidoreductase [Actinomycetota bacterium]